MGTEEIIGKIEYDIIPDIINGMSKNASKKYSFECDNKVLSIAFSWHDEDTVMGIDEIIHSKDAYGYLDETDLADIICQICEKLGIEKSDKICIN